MTKKTDTSTELYVGQVEILYRNPNSPDYSKVFQPGHPDPLDCSHLSAGQRQRLLDLGILTTKKPPKPADKHETTES